jgi:hypothetical protein
MREQLETNFTYNMTIGDKQSAHEVLKSLMRYRLIPKDDPRCNPKTRMFGAVDISIDNWDEYDYRREPGDFIPKYLLCNLKRYTTFDVKTMGDWVVRQEGDYEGRERARENELHVRMQLVDKRTKVAPVVKDIDDILRSGKQKLGNLEEFSEAVKVGTDRIYQCHIDHGVTKDNCNPAYALIRMNDDGAFVCLVVIDYRRLYNARIEVKQFTEKMLAALPGMCDVELQIKPVFSYEKAIDMQNKREKATIAGDAEWVRINEEQKAAAEQKKKERAERAAAKKKATTKSKNVDAGENVATS